MIDLKIDGENGATPEGETRDEPTEASAEVTPMPSPRVSLPERPGSSRPETSGERGRRADQLGDEDGRKLIVGRDIVVTGKISSLDRLVVEGRLEAKLQECREIDIGETGHFKGQAEFERADIAGIFEGDLTAREHLVVRATGRVDGKVSFGELEVERGGQIIGELQVFVEGAQANGKGGATGRKKAPIAKDKDTPAK